MVPSGRFIRRFKLWHQQQTTAQLLLSAQSRSCCDSGVGAAAGCRSTRQLPVTAHAPDVHVSHSRRLPACSCASQVPQRARACAHLHMASIFDIDVCKAKIAHPQCWRMSSFQNTKCKEQSTRRDDHHNPENADCHRKADGAQHNPTAPCSTAELERWIPTCAQLQFRARRWWTSSGIR